MKSLLINEHELSALMGQPYILYALYLYLRSHMDYGTGIVGFKRGISYQSISEALYLEPEPGIKSGSPHRSAIRRAIDRLERINLLQRTGGLDNLVFRMPMAQTDKSAKKQADTKPTPQADTPKPARNKADSTQADTPKNPQADTPPVSGNSLLINTTTTSPSPEGSSSDSLIFPKRTDEASKAAMLKSLQGINPADQQELLDELQGCIEKGKVQSAPAALLHGMVQRFKTGAFNPVYAHKVKDAREQAIIRASEPPRLVVKADKEKGRQHMAQVKQLFKKGASSAN